MRTMPRGALTILLALLAWLCLRVKGRDFWGGSDAGFRGLSSGSGRERDYYELLGVHSSCTQSDIKRAFRRKAMSTHPDKGGDTEAFKKLVEAYEVLSDPSRRSLYDLRGEAPRAHPFSSHPAFSSFFRSYSVPTVYQLEVTLEDLFHGRDLALSLNGRQLNIHIAAGMAHGAHLRVRLDGHRDLIFVLKQVPHAVFKRKGADLYMHATISLAEALLGFELPVQLPSGESIVLHYGDIVAPGETLVFEGLGMPIPSSPDSSRRGRLFLTATVRFPERLSPTGPNNELETEALRRLLSEPASKSSEGARSKASSPVSPSPRDGDGRDSGRRVTGSKSGKNAFRTNNGFDGHSAYFSQGGDNRNNHDDDEDEDDNDGDEGSSSFFRSFLFR